MAVVSAKHAEVERRRVKQELDGKRANKSFPVLLVWTTFVRFSGLSNQHLKTTTLIRHVSFCVSAILTLSFFSTSLTAQITEIIDATGDGGGNTLSSSWGIATDSAGNVFVAARFSDNAFKITSGGVITEIIDATGDGTGNTLSGAYGIATDPSGNVFVVGGSSNNVFKITPAGVITEIIDATGDGTGNTLSNAQEIATDLAGNVYVGGVISSNVFKIATPGTCSTGGTPCTITEIIDTTGDGGGNTLFLAFGVATDASGNVFVVGGNNSTPNVLKIATPGTCSTVGTPCTITEIIDATGDGGGNVLSQASGVTTDGSGNVFVAGNGATSNVFKIATPGTCSTVGTPCTITEIIDGTGDGLGNTLLGPHGVATDASGNVFVTAQSSHNAFKITPGGVITEIIDATGDGGGNTLNATTGVATDGLGNVFVTGSSSNNAFKITLPSAITVNAKIFLEGAYQSGTDDMSTSLNATLPLTQPYDSSSFNDTPLDYDGSESVISMPAGIVDWVLVQIRQGDAASPPMDSVATRAALLKSDGTVVDLDGSSPVSFTGLTDDDYYVVIYHRNHLGVISESTLALSASSALYDFSAASSQAYGISPMKEVETGVWGLFAADGNNDGQITAPDFNLWNAATTAGATGYEPSDYNLDGIVTAPDFNLWNANTTAGASSKVPAVGEAEDLRCPALTSDLVCPDGASSSFAGPFEGGLGDQPATVDGICGSGYYKQAGDICLVCPGGVSGFGAGNLVDIGGGNYQYNLRCSP